MRAASRAVPSARPASWPQLSPRGNVVAPPGHFVDAGEIRTSDARRRRNVRGHLVSGVLPLYLYPRRPTSGLCVGVQPFRLALLFTLLGAATTLIFRLNASTPAFSRPESKLDLPSCSSP